MNASLKDKSTNTLHYAADNIKHPENLETSQGLTRYVKRSINACLSRLGKSHLEWAQEHGTALHHPQWWGNEWMINQTRQCGQAEWSACLRACQIWTPWLPLLECAKGSSLFSENQSHKLPRATPHRWLCRNWWKCSINLSCLVQFCLVHWTICF